MFLLDTAATLRRRYPEQLHELPVDLQTRVAALQQISRRLCELSGVELSVRGRLPTGPCLLVANHLSYLDPLAVIGVVPAIPLAKQEIRRWPGLGPAVVRLGCLFVDRADAHSGARVLRRAGRCLARGVSVLTFPEGTTSPGDDVLPLRRGIFGVARQQARPVVPIAIHLRPREAAWVDDQLLLPHLLKTLARGQTRVALHIGAPIPHHAAPSAEQLAALARSRLRTLLHELRAEP